MGGDPVPAATVYTLNLIDLLCTLYVLSLGCTELNPLMQSVPVLVVYKVIVVGGLLWWLSGRPERTARIGLLICTAVYTALCIYHFYGLLMIGGMLC